MLYDKDGKEVEALTKSEFEAKLEEVKGESLKEAEALKATLAENEKRLAELQEQLEEAKSKGEDVEDLKKKIVDEKKLDKMFKEKEKEIYGKVTNLVNTKRRDDIIKEMSAGDSELEKKIRVNFDRLSGETETDEAIRNKVIEAYRLSVDAFSPSVLNKVTSSKPSGQFKQSNQLSDEVREAGRMFGLSDEDFKKFAK